MAGKIVHVRFYGRSGDVDWEPSDPRLLLGTLENVYDVRLSDGWLVCTCAKTGRVRWIRVPNDVAEIAMDEVPA